MAPGKIASALRRHSAPHRMAAMAGAAALVLAGCATQPVPQAAMPGFWAGLGHGFVALIALVASLFFPVRMYAFPNGGVWYDTGFAIGFGASILLLVMLCIARIGGFITRGH